MNRRSDSSEPKNNGDDLYPLVLEKESQPNPFDEDVEDGDAEADSFMAHPFRSFDDKPKFRGMTMMDTNPMGSHFQTSSNMWSFDEHADNDQPLALEEDGFTAFNPFGIPAEASSDPNFTLPLPGVVSPCTTFTSKAEPSVIRSLVKDTLSASGVEFVEEGDFCISGNYIGARDSAMYSFDINVYQTETAGVYLVDVHRTMGHGFDFTQVFFRSILNSLSEIVLDSKLKPTSAVAEEAEKDSECSVSANRALLETLASMACSNYLKTAREGCVSLTRISQQKSNISAFSSNMDVTVSILNATLGSEDPEIQRCGATLLARLSCDDDFRKEIQNDSQYSNLSRSVQTLSSCAELLETKRQCHKIAVSFGQV